MFNIFFRRRTLSALESQKDEIEDLRTRITAIEQRLFNYYRNRWDAIDKLADYLVGAELRGDYLEFGVFEGRTFSYAYKVMAPLFPDMRFVALDSFEGLPEPAGIDAVDGYSSSFVHGQFASTEEQFLAQMRMANPELDPARLRIVKGWFDRTLTAGNPALADTLSIRAAWIDCDLYASTVPVLDFIADKLQVGTVILFDDWRCFRNLPQYGEQRACAEWLERNPQIQLRPFVDFGFHGMSFTVARC